MPNLRVLGRVEMWPRNIYIYIIHIYIYIPKSLKSKTTICAFLKHLLQFSLRVMWLLSPTLTPLVLIPEIFHDDVIKWKHFPRYWPFVRGIHRPLVNSPHKGQWRGALMFSLICAWINGWVNNREAGDLRRHRALDVWRHCNAGKIISIAWFLIFWRLICLCRQDIIGHDLIGQRALSWRVQMISVWSVDQILNYSTQNFDRISNALEIPLVDGRLKTFKPTHRNPV